MPLFTAGGELLKYDFWCWNNWWRISAQTDSIRNASPLTLAVGGCESHRPLLFGLVKYLDLFWRLIRQPDFPNVRAGDFDDSQDVSDKRLRKASAGHPVAGFQEPESKVLHFW